MGLKQRTSYENKQGETIQLKTPRMKVLAKDMDDNEKHTFVMLGRKVETHLPNTQFNKSKFPKYEAFVKYEDEDQAFTLELGYQAWGAIVSKNPSQGSKISIWKSDDRVECSVEGGTENKEVVENQENVKKFVSLYNKMTKPGERTLPHALVTYMETCQTKTMKEIATGIALEIKPKVVEEEVVEESVGTEQEDK